MVSVPEQVSVYSFDRMRNVSLLAPSWHTLAFVALLVSVPLLAFFLGTPASAVDPSRLASQYLPFLAAQWGLVLFVWLGGLRPGGTTIAAVMGRSMRSVDVALAAMAWVVVTAVQQLLPVTTSADLLPVTPLEKGAWCAVAFTAALVEEFIYRGYLQRQLAVLSRSVSGGVVLQALLFGLAHADRGPAAALQIAVYGLGLGVLVQLRGSLWAALICHFGLDLAAGLLR